MASAVSRPRHRADRGRVRRPRSSRGASTGMALAAGGVAVLAVLGVQAGGTFALWSSVKAVPASTITSGTTGLTVNGQSTATLTGLDTTKLGPGAAVATTITLANTGTTILTVAASQGVVLADSQGLAAELTVRTVAVPPAQCGPSTTGGVVGRIPGFQSSAAPVVITPGSSATVCLVVALDSDAPSSAQGGTTTFRVTFTGKQVGP